MGGVFSKARTVRGQARASLLEVRLPLFGRQTGRPDWRVDRAGHPEFTLRGAISNAKVRPSASMTASIAAMAKTPAMGFRLIQPENGTIEPCGANLTMPCLQHEH